MYIIFSEISRPFQDPKSTSELLNRATHIGKPIVILYVYIIVISIIND